VATPKQPQRKTFWTKEKLRLLKANFPKMSTQDCAALLEQTTEATKKKASRLGLAKNRAYLRTLGRA
jgi:hypothetical protein